MVSACFISVSGEKIARAEDNWIFVCYFDFKPRLGD